MGTAASAASGFAAGFAEFQWLGSLLPPWPLRRPAIWLGFGLRLEPQSVEAAGMFQPLVAIASVFQLLGDGGLAPRVLVIEETPLPEVRGQFSDRHVVLGGALGSIVEPVLEGVGALEISRCRFGDDRRRAQSLLLPFQGAIDAPAQDARPLAFELLF